jgi:IS30 family transposase
VLLEAGLSQYETAGMINVDRSTVSREVRRNRSPSGYNPIGAHRMALSRRRAPAKRLKMTPALIELIEHLLCLDFSPEQVSGFLRRHHQLHISHQSIYRHVWADKKRAGELYHHLRRSNRKQKKRYGSKQRRGQIPGRVSIEKRPAIVEAKARLGDWEADTITGKQRRGALLSVVERKSKLTLLKALPDRQAKRVARALVELLRPYQHKVLTITADNGKEFTLHDRVAKNLQDDVCFAHPYHAWERGLNENTNGLIRQYFPKGIDFTKIKAQSDQFVMDYQRVEREDCPQSEAVYAASDET